MFLPVEKVINSFNYFSEVHMDDINVEGEVDDRYNSISRPQSMILNYTPRPLTLPTSTRRL